MYRVLLSAAAVLLATNSAFAWGINTAYVTQVGSAQIAATSQKGEANYSSTLQVGGLQAARTKQRGVGNFSHTEQWGALQASSTSQHGAFNQAVTIQDGLLQLSIIEHTLRHTTLGDLGAGDAVHLEADVIGKFVRRLVAPYVDDVLRRGALAPSP